MMTNKPFEINNYIDTKSLIALLENMPSPIIYKVLDGTVVYCNKAFLEFNQLNREDVIGKHLRDVVHKNMFDFYEELDKKIITNKLTNYQTEENMMINNTKKHIIITRSVHLDDQGNALGIIAVFQDNTETKLQEEKNQLIAQIRKSFWEINQSLTHFPSDECFFNMILQKFEPIFSKMNCATVMNLNDGVISTLASLHFDHKYIETFSIKLEDSFLWSNMKDDLTRPTIVNGLDNAIKYLKPFVKTEQHLTIQSSLVIPISFEGTIKWLLFLDSAEDNIYDELDLYASEFLQQEIPTFYRIYKLTSQAVQLSRYDSLTGLLNRGYFESIFEDRLKVASRQTIPLKVVVFDLDGLKRVNDTLGHHAGDQYLLEFSSFISQTFRGSDTFARTGGDEFIGLFNTNDSNDLEEKLKELRNDFEEREMAFDGNTFHGSYSFGLASYPDDGHNIDQLISIADRKMYADKNRVNNKFSR